jgi:Zn-dependent membrane protease YugP
MIFDPMYFLFLAPGILLAMWAQVKVKSAYAQGQKYRPRSGMNGAQTAQRILNVYGINDVAIEPVQSFLGDHYDSRHKVLRLSPGVYHGQSLAALGIAAHECGHALQDAQRYGPLVIRNGIVPLANFGSNAAWLLIIGGFVMNWFGLVLAGIAAFSLVVLLQLINLPVEFNASSRARDILLNQGMVTAEEDQVVRKVLSAAAMTYVAATLTAILTLLYFLFRAYGSRN